MPTGPRRPTPSPDAGPVTAAGGEGLVPDVIGPDLDVLFCGINPGRLSGATGHHFAHPGNRFWKALEASGFTDRRLRPDQQHQMLDYGLGITNLAGRTTATAAELTRDELRDGAAILEDKVARYRPKVVAFLGLTAYRTAFRRPRATVGPQEDRLGDARLWVLPNPSGLNASWPAPRLADAFRDLKQAAGA